MKTSFSPRQRLLRLTQAAMITALSYVCFQFLKLRIPIGAGELTLHVGNAIVVLGALLLGGAWGGTAGALGLTLADLTSGYATSAPKTFLLKLVLGLIAGFVSHRMMKLGEKTAPKEQFRIALVSSIVALGLNVVLDPIAGYFYKSYVLGIPQDMATTLAKLGSVSTLVNTIVSVIFVAVLWPAVYPALRRSGLLLFMKESHR